MSSECKGFSIYRGYAVLNLSFAADVSGEIIELYETHIKKHNEDFFKGEHSNSGFDLFVLGDVGFNDFMKNVYVNFGVKCEMFYHDKTADNTWGSNPSCGFYLYPRSSISKMPLIMSNHVGIIDAGYRGNIIGAFRCVQNEPFVLEKTTRITQICHPSLCPIYVKIVSEKELTTTERGSGGFGSTGLKSV